MPNNPDLGIQLPSRYHVIALDTVFSLPLKGVRCGATGNVKFVDGADQDITITNVIVGEIIKGPIKKIYTTGTTVTSPTTNLVGLY